MTDDIGVAADAIVRAYETAWGTKHSQDDVWQFAYDDDHKTSDSVQGTLEIEFRDATMRHLGSASASLRVQRVRGATFQAWIADSSTGEFTVGIALQAQPKHLASWDDTKKLTLDVFALAEKKVRGRP